MPTPSAEPLVAGLRRTAGSIVRRLGLRAEPFRLETRAFEFENASGRCTVVYAGPERHALYLASAFGGANAETPLGRFKPERVLAAARASGLAPDAVFYEIPSARRAALEPSADFKIPVWTEMTIDVSDGGTDAVASRPSFSNMRRRIRQGGFKKEYSSAPADLREFYDQMYVPYISKAHAASAFLHTFEEAAAYFATGELVKIYVGDRWVAGEIVQFGEKGVMRMLGVRDGCETEIRNGVADALNFYAIVRLKEKGSASVSFGWSRGFLKDGVLRYKARNGAGLSGLTHAGSGHLSLRVLNASPALLELLKKNPFVDETPGGYEGVFFAGAGPREDFFKDALCPGLKGVRIYSENLEAAKAAAAFSPLPARIGDLREIVRPDYAG